MYEIEEYTTSTGDCPVTEFKTFLKKSGEKADLKKMDSYILLLERIGLEVLSNENWAKRLDDNIYELRPKNNRVIFFSFKNEKFVLLHCFVKKTNETPPEEIEKAKKEATDYERRFKNGK